jgi:RNA polymerase sigma-70 factor (ECF subfamily)
MSNPSPTTELSPWTGLTDEEVVMRVLAGDAALFEVLMRRHNQRLYRIARSVVRDDAEAEDVMQHAYVQAYTRLGQFEGRARFSTWLTRIAFHEALTRAKRRRREGQRSPASPFEEDPMSSVKSTDPTPEQQAMHAELRAELERAVDRLPGLYRAVFVLRDVEGMSTADAAATLDIREDAVKTRLHRARAMLREELYRRAGASAGSVFAFHLSRCDGLVAAVRERLHLPLLATLRN